MSCYNFVGLTIFFDSFNIFILENGIFHILILIVAAIAVVSGFRRCISGQLSSLLGMAFGIVCCRIFGAEFSQVIKTGITWISTSPYKDYTSEVVSFSIIYLIVYFIFNFVTRILQYAVRSFGGGMLDRIIGALFSLIKYLMFLSIAYNLILCHNQNTVLLNAVAADDGNMIESVIKLESGLLGCPDAGELAHLVQLREARKISCNIILVPVVIKDKYHSSLQTLEIAKLQDKELNILG